MKTFLKSTTLSLALLAAPLAASAESTKEFVTKAVTELLVNGDVTAVDRYWADDYIQRNPLFPSGAGVIKDLFANMPPHFKYEIGMVAAEGDLVWFHSRVTGFGPKPMIVVDIFRVADGKIVEHWDIMQEEVLETASGVPMFEPKK